MADRKLMEEYENSVMSLAVSEMLEEFGKELEEEYKNMVNAIIGNFTPGDLSASY